LQRTGNFATAAALRGEVAGERTGNFATTWSGSWKPDAGIIATEIFTRLADTGGREEEIRIPLPATPGLRAIKEVVLTWGEAKKELPVDLRIIHCSVAPPPP
jgi:hypothetical protein